MLDRRISHFGFPHGHENCWALGMNLWQRFCYIGPTQAVRKLGLRFERALKRRWWVPPEIPPRSPIDWQIRLLNHEFDLRRPDCWRYSPDTGRAWPMEFAGTLPITGPDAVGDVRLIWELNRHQFLPELARRDPALARAIWHDWVVQNPYECGVNWTSALEVGLRLIAWEETLAVQPGWRKEFTGASEQHARFVRHHLSTDWIPRGNHLVGEAAALAVYMGRKPNRWLRTAAREQFYGSGVNREHSVAYHRFVTELFALGGLHLEAAVAYLAAIRQPDGSLPAVGDSDDGRAAPAAVVALPPAPRGPVAFADAGVYVMRRGTDYCFVRVGDFGLPPNHAHAHADLLSPILWLGGEPVLVDSGTYTYNGDSSARRYFRSAHAHNVMTVDGADFGLQNGTFSWERVPRAECIRWTGDELVGWHDAYRNLGVTFQRTLRWAATGLEIHDLVGGAGRHRLVWRFHLHPQLKIAVCGISGFELSRGRRIGVKTNQPSKCREATGWYSRGYGQREKIAVCEVECMAALPVEATFLIS